jgi:pyruvate dehydrogenase E2 component (dihydrolipoamide acetyltransferase)
MSVFNLPDLGEGLRDAEIVSWHVSPGDHVVVDQPLVSVETAKAVVEIPSPQSGYIEKVHGDPGEVVEIGQALVEFSDEGRRDAGAIVGDLPTASRVAVTPAVRHLAGKLGVDLSSVSGSGPGGTITTTDVEHAAAPQMAGVQIERISGVRRAMAQAMTTSGASIVPATVSEEADIHAWSRSADVTIRLIRAIAAGIATEPALNAWYHPEKSERWLHSEIHLGLAIDTEQGLFAPVLRSIASRTDEDLRTGLQQLRADVSARAISAEELRGQTITLSNFGMIGGVHASLVIVPPQVAILGAGRIFKRAIVEKQSIVSHRVLPLSLTFDHRIVTGGEAARFLAAVKTSLETAGD